MKELYYTLLADGTSDKVLIPILTWLLRQHGVTCAIHPQWGETGLRFLGKSRCLSDKILITLKYDPCDLLFIHRDAEREPREKRVQEINEAINQLKTPPCYVCIIPVRMQEAWLLFDENAIRQAAGNPKGREPIKLPSLKSIENEPNPKKLLHDLLCKASERKGRDLKKFRSEQAAQRITELITDFSPLRILSAFQLLEQEITDAIRTLEQGN